MQHDADDDEKLGADIERVLAGEDDPAERVDDLGDRLRSLYETRNDKTLFLMGAGSLRYGDVIPLIDVAKGAGVTRVGIVTESSRGIRAAP